MSHRRPPRLATWLLDRFGFARNNPPLTGDLLEEFENGRSSAWYWRQTLVAISIGSVRNVRRCWRPLTGTIIGWAAQAGVAFFLWRFRLLPQPPQVVQTITNVATTSFFVWLVLWWKPQKTVASQPSPAPKSMAGWAWFHFKALLPIYCLCVLQGMPPEFALSIQLFDLYFSIKDVLVRGS